MEKRLLDLENIHHILFQKPLIRRFFSSPQIRLEQKEYLLKKNFENDGDPQIFSLLRLLLFKGHFNHLPDIVKEYRRRVYAALGILEVHLMAATSISETMKEKLKQKLEKSYQSKIELKEELKPQLIGGGIVVIENQLIDFSIRGKLDRLNKKLLAE